MPEVLTELTKSLDILPSNLKPNSNLVHARDRKLRNSVDSAQLKNCRKDFS